jgi:Family of unknown function (DUF5722)
VTLPADRACGEAHKIPSTKLQAPEKSQTPNPNAARDAGLAAGEAPVTANLSDAARKGCFGAWCLEFLWSLVLGVWSFATCLSAVVGFSAWAVAVPGEGIQHVIATKDQILISGLPDRGLVRIVELQPFETVSASSTGMVLKLLVETNSSARLPRFDGARDRIYSSFAALREGSDGTVALLGTNRFVDEMREVAKWSEAFPQAASKKGLQVQMIDDAIALGIKHAALNVNLAQMIELGHQPDSLEWRLDGQTYHFDRHYLDTLDRQIKPLADARIIVSLILLYYESANEALNTIMLHPSYHHSCPNHLSAFNTTTPDGLRYFKACIEFLADRYSQPDSVHGRAVNFIVGNEINSHWFWYNRGRVSMEMLAEDYLRTVRVCHTAVRKIAAQARVYLSLEHHWNMRYAGGDAQQTFAGRRFVDYFNACAQARGDFDWHLAFHPYPENLFECRTWNDRSATFSEDTPRITFKNLEMLPRYFRRPELLYHGQPRHIILSEQGFHTANDPEGELRQAAAYAYAYYKTANLPGIDAFILHRQIDHRDEGGLKLGLWRRDEASSAPSTPGAKKQIYQVFQHADMPDWRRAFEFALPVIGIKGWEDVWPKTD